jgi:CHAD domain-containing protein
MKQSPGLLQSLDDSWKRLSSVWRKAGAKASESAIHDFRVAARRLLARIELAGAVLEGESARPARKRVKKGLKKMGPLRDLHVQLETLDGVPANAAVRAFKQRLKTQVNQAVPDVKHYLRDENRLRVKDRIAALKAEMEGRREVLDDNVIRQSIEGSIAARREAYIQACHAFETDSSTLHAMRIALKKYRYVVEAGEALIGESSGKTLRNMRASQTLMGETRDIEILMSELKRWAASENRQPEAVSILNGLARRRKSLIAKIAKAAHALEDSAPSQSVLPIREITHAASSEAPSAELRDAGRARV